MATTPQSVGLVTGALFFIILLLCPVPVAAADPWLPRDTVLQGTALTFLWIDYKQTLRLQDHGLKESNPVLGEQPHRRQITQYFLSRALATTALAYYLPRDWRLGLQSGSIGVSLSCITKNYSLGVAIRF